MPPLLRSIVAVVSGLLAAFLTVTAVEGINSRLHPLPPGLDISDANAMKQYVASLPSLAFVLVVAGWGLGALLGSWVAVRVGRRSTVRLAVVVTGLLVCGAVANMLMLPHPPWVWFAGLAALLLGGYAGGRLAQRGLGAVARESQFI